MYQAALAADAKRKAENGKGSLKSYSRKPPPAQEELPAINVDIATAHNLSGMTNKRTKSTYDFAGDSDGDDDFKTSWQPSKRSTPGPSHMDHGCQVSPAKRFAVPRVRQTTMGAFMQRATQETKAQEPSLPAGIINLGNTCYLGAVLQSLLSLGPFTTDLCGAAVSELRLPDSSVVAAMSQLALQHGSALQGMGAGSSLIDPSVLRVAMAEAGGQRWRSALQQDAHEFLTALLDKIQGEVLMAQAARDGCKRIRLRAVACPVAKNLSGCMQLTLTCRCCQHVTKVKEPFLHLSLELPACSAGAGQPQHSLVSLLAAHLKDEVVQKTCDKCGAVMAEHTAQRTLRRLPRILIIHLKRFQVSLGPGGTAQCKKLEVEVPACETLQLERFTSSKGGAQLLPAEGGVEGRYGDKENTPVNAQRPQAPPTSTQQQQRVGSTGGSGPLKQLRGFYSTPETAVAPQPSTPTREDCVLLLDEAMDDDAALQAVLAESLREYEQQQQELEAQQQAEIDAMEATACQSPTSCVDLFAGIDGREARTSGRLCPEAISLVSPAQQLASIAAPPQTPLVAVQILEDSDDEDSGATAAVAATPGKAAAAGSCALPTAESVGASRHASPASCSKHGALVSGSVQAGQYRLHGVVSHQGPLASCGHFVADIWHSQACCWYRHDDSVVSRSSLDVVLRRTTASSYLLFYTSTLLPPS